MTTVILIFAAVLFGLLWGLLQGAIMIQPGDARAVKHRIGESIPDGVRNHEWFGLYHWGWVVALGAFLAAMIAWDIGAPRGELWPLVRYAIMTLGCAVIGWETSELGYSQARYARWVPAQENIVFLDAASKRLYDKWVRRLHFMRAAAGIILIIGGVI